jgi:hypothetical protein
MFEIDRLGRRIGTAVLLLTTLWALPASAEVGRAESGATVVAESATSSNERLAVLSDSDAMALASKRKRKPLVRPASARLAALSQQGSDCAWCGRHFVLIIGIGY